MFKNIFSFEGRIRRTEYGISFIIYLVFYLLVTLLADGVNGIKILYLGIIPVIWFLWAQGAKRCHDLGKSGWWQIVPFYGLWLLFEKGVEGENEFGDDPKGNNVAMDIMGDIPYNAPYSLDPDRNPKSEDSDNFNQA